MRAHIFYKKVVIALKNLHISQKSSTFAHKFV